MLLGVCSGFGFFYFSKAVTEATGCFIGKIVNRAFPKYSSKRDEALLGVRVRSSANMHAECEKLGVVLGPALSQNFSVPFFVLRQPVSILCLSCK